MTKIEIQTVKQFISHMEAMMHFMQKLLAEEKALPPEPKTDHEKLKEITELRMLSKSGVWPDAIPSEEICTTEDEKLHQGAKIVHELIKVDMIDKTVLQIGCGEGHVAYVMTNLHGPRKVVGCDAKKQDWKFENTNNLLLTNSWTDVEKNGPYDIILAHDVMDHTGDFDQTLEKIKSIKTEDCKICLRCHPWVSRHGAHADNNKAFIHLIFNEEELGNMGVKTLTSHKLLDPQESYKKTFKTAGYSILSEKETKRDVEMFFTHNPNILRRIKEKFKNSANQKFASGEEFPRNLLELEFIDYVLI